MRYEHKRRGWWVEIEGAADVPQAELDALYGGNEQRDAVLGKLVQCARFTDAEGAEFDPAEGDPKGGQWKKLSFRQFVWLRKQVIQCALDEVADPEA